MCKSEETSFFYLKPSVPTSLHPSIHPSKLRTLKGRQTSSICLYCFYAVVLLIQRQFYQPRHRQLFVTHPVNEMFILTADLAQGLKKTRQNKD